MLWHNWLHANPMCCQMITGCTSNTCAVQVCCPSAQDIMLQCVMMQSEQDSGLESTSDNDRSEQQPLVRDADNVLACLKRALKIANAAQQQLAVALKSSDTGPAFLYVEILNQYLYYFDQGLPNITPSVIQVSFIPLFALHPGTKTTQCCSQNKRRCLSL